MINTELMDLKREFRQNQVILPGKPKAIINLEINLYLVEFDIEFEGFEGGYEFHGNADEIFQQFFGGKNPFTGLKS